MFLVIGLSVIYKNFYNIIVYLILYAVILNSLAFLTKRGFFVGMVASTESKCKGL